jgi:4-diphosphocytidyl-2-C-methyl-D-erythritol kinase
MIVFPNAKINLGLHVLRKRNDGYHDIETCFYPVPLTDVLEVIESNSMQFDFSGRPIPGGTGDNLVVKAYKLLKEEFGLPPVHIHLHKVIPMGAGLGGGSSDAAFMLVALNQLFGLNLNKETLASLAARLGSDCPFFIYQHALLGTGTGTTLEPIDLSLKGNYITIIHPGIHISTAEAYSRLVPNEDRKTLTETLKGNNWKQDLVNDFTRSVYDAYPEIQEIESSCYEAGASYACMSGSGSSVFALSDAPITPELPDGYFIWQGRLA